MLIYLNSQQRPGRADEFLKWDHANGKVSNGLETRREAERSLFLS
jgi:lysozyme